MATVAHHLKVKPAALAWPKGLTTTVVPPDAVAPAVIAQCPDLVPLLVGKPKPAGCPLYEDISAAAVDPDSAAILAACTAVSNTWPGVIKNGPPGLVNEFGSTRMGTTHPIGMPYAVVKSTQKLSPVSWIRNPPWGNYTLTNAIDPGPTGDNNYPMPDDYSLIQLGPDHHAIILDSDTFTLWEGWKVYLVNGVWQCAMMCKFDLKQKMPQRRDGRTSADAAGLPILPLLVRRDEVEDCLKTGAKEFGHALRFTLPIACCHASQVSPATHHAGKNMTANLPSFGDRWRLKASFDISTYPPETQILLNTLKIRGMFMADIGGVGHISGTPDARWNEHLYANLHNVKLFTDFEIVKRASAPSVAMG